MVLFPWTTDKFLLKKQSQSEELAAGAENLGTSNPKLAAWLHTTRRKIVLLTLLSERERKQVLTGKQIILY